jgi:hypothetical protein
MEGRPYDRVASDDVKNIAECVCAGCHCGHIHFSRLHMFDPLIDVKLERNIRLRDVLVAVFLVERDRVFMGWMTEMHGFWIKDEIDELVLIKRQDLVGELRFNELKIIALGHEGLIWFCVEQKHLGSVDKFVNDRPVLVKSSRALVQD